MKFNTAFAIFALSAASIVAASPVLEAVPEPAAAVYEVSEVPSPLKARQSGCGFTCLDPQFISDASSCPCPGQEFGCYLFACRSGTRAVCDIVDNSNGALTNCRLES